MNPAEKFLTVHTGELEWEDGENIIGLPPGVEVKIVAEGYDDVSELVDKFVKFPPATLSRFTSTITFTAPS